MAEQPKTITLLYKSGAKVYLKCSDLTVTKSGGRLVEVSWGKNGHIEPRPMFLGVDEIAAIFEGKA